MYINEVDRRIAVNDYYETLLEGRSINVSELESMGVEREVFKKFLIENAFAFSEEGNIISPVGICL